jgi:hypothetical protein
VQAHELLRPQYLLLLYDVQLLAWQLTRQCICYFGCSHLHNGLLLLHMHHLRHRCWLQLR